METTKATVKGTYDANKNIALPPPSAVKMAATKATVKGTYDANKNIATSKATIAFTVSDVKLKLAATDATFSKGVSSLQGIVLSVDKPGSFIVDYDVPTNDLRFQFMNSVRVRGKPLNMTYVHFWKDNRTTVDGSVTFDPSNKLTASYMLGTRNCKVKYAYSHGDLRRTVLEPSYDVAKNSWDFALSRRVYGEDIVKATYQTGSKNLALEWSRDSIVNGSFKILASMKLDQQCKVPNLIAETTWNYEV